MTKLFKDEYLHDEKLLNDPNYKLQSLRDLHCYNAMTHVGSHQDLIEHQQKTVEDQEHKTRYLSDDSLYD